MRAFYLAYTGDAPIVSQPARQSTRGILAQPARELHDQALPQLMADIPWFHNVVLIEKAKDRAQRLWYAREAAERRPGHSSESVVQETRRASRSGLARGDHHGLLPEFMTPALPLTVRNGKPGRTIACPIST